VEVGLVDWVAQVAVDEVFEEDLLDLGRDEGGDDEETCCM
jgi:hypothetical protein